MRAFIIHLPGERRRDDNVRQLVADLGRAGVGPVEVVRGQQPATAGPLRSPGEWGCYLSHLACLERVAAEGAPALVLEDDARLVVEPSRLAALLATEEPWDLLHVGHLQHEVFRAWDPELMAAPLLRVRGVLYGTQAYAVRPDGLAARLELLRRLPHEPPREGGGVGFDGALCELAWRDPALVRLAPPRSLFVELPGLGSRLRQRSRVQRARELAVWRWREATGRLRSAR